MKVAVVMGSKSDLDVVKKAIDTLRKLGVDYEAHIYSAHRAPKLIDDFAADLDKKDVEVVIAAAGKAAHLAGAVAARTALPVIGLPLSSNELEGMDALLSTVQMPPGIPVATVAIDGAENAAVLAVQILALKYDTLRDTLYKYREEMRMKVAAADAELQEGLYT